MKLEIYQIDAFANHVFEGNPAAVCPLDEWLEDWQMLAIAAENNLAETAFFVKEQDAYRIRWFTPEVEVDLCGHATLASAYVLYQELGCTDPSLTFNSNSGPLMVTLEGDLITLDFPSQICQPCDAPDGLAQALGVTAQLCFENVDLMVVLESQQQLSDLKPDFALLSKLEFRGVIATAPSTEYDFVNRFFAPNVGINEDPVTGSAFTKLIPYWAVRLGKTKMTAKQVSKRGGEVACEHLGDRVLISGKAVKYLSGTIDI